MAGGINLYEYAGSNPVAFDDSFGLCGPVTPVCLAAAAVAGRVLASPPGQRMLERGAQITARASGQLAAINRQVGNIMSALAKHDHLSAARLERTGRLHTGYNHAKEVLDFANGLRNATVRLKQIMSNQEVSETVRREAAQILSRTSNLLDELKHALRP